MIRAFSFFLLNHILFLSLSLSAQEVLESSDLRGKAQKEGIEELYVPMPKAEALFLINNITYYVNGQTQTWALEHRYHLKQRTRFSSETEMYNYFEGKERTMMGNKIFSHVEISYTTELLPAGNLKESIVVEGREVSPSTPIYAVHLFVQVQDSITTIIPPPIPRIINDNLILSLRFTEKNFMGSLMSLEGNGRFSFDLNNLTHNLLPSWNLGFNLGNIYFPGSSLAWGISTGYAYQTELVNDPDSGKRTLEYDYHKLDLGIGTGFTIFPHFSYAFNISNSLRFGNKFHLDTENKEESIRRDLGIPNNGLGYTLSWSHGLTYSTISDSTKNMRKGYSLSLGNSISYNFNTVNITSDISWGSIFFQPFLNDFIELSFRYSGLWNITGTRHGISSIRGVRSHNVSGFLGNYINTTFLFTFWRWPGVWEAQMGLFLDGGITQRMDESDPKNKRPIPLSFKNFDIGMGVEGRLHLDVLRSFVIYGRLGVDMKRLPSTKRELLRFWGGKYDFTIGFSTTY